MFIQFIPETKKCTPIVQASFVPVTIFYSFQFSPIDWVFVCRPAGTGYHIRLPKGPPFDVLYIPQLVGSTTLRTRIREQATYLKPGKPCRAHSRCPTALNLCSCRWVGSSSRNGGPDRMAQFQESVQLYHHSMNPGS